MIRAAIISIVVSLAACAPSPNRNAVCSQPSAPAGCGSSCDPNGANTCPAGLYCASNGKCSADCTPGGNQCAAGETCSADGHCVGGDQPDAPVNTTPDADCPAVHFTPMKTTPSVELLLDRSGSMKMTDIAPTRYGALHTALTGSTGAVTSTQASVYFGAALFSGAETPCPPNASLDGFSVPRKLNNASAIDALITANPPNGSTPTAVWVTAVAQDFTANPPPTGSPPIILLATDGEPNGCGTTTNDNGASVAAAQAAYTGGVRLFIIGLAGIAPQFLQDMANAGAGKPTGQAPNCAGCAPFYTASDPTSLANGFNQIIGGVISCDLTISGTVDPTTASQGTVTLNGVVLQYGTDWTVDPNGMVIHLMGAACNTLKTSANPTLDASFPCGVIVN
jgi:hypothetical protein